MDIEVIYDSKKITVEIDNKLFDTLNHLGNVKRGRFGFIKNHISGIDNPKCLQPTISDITFITNPIYGNWLKKMIDAVISADFNSVINSIDSVALSEIKSKCKTDINKAFENAKNELLESYNKSVAGDVESDGYRLGQHLCYCHYNVAGISVRCHLVTEDDGTGHKRPITNEDGQMVINSIMLPFYIINRAINQKGIYESTNSRANTLIKNAIKNYTGIKEWQHISINKNNYDYINLDKKTISTIVKDIKFSLNEIQFIEEIANVDFVQEVNEESVSV